MTEQFPGEQLYDGMSSDELDEYTRDAMEEDALHATFDAKPQPQEGEQ